MVSSRKVVIFLLIALVLTGSPMLFGKFQMASGHDSNNTPHFVDKNSGFADISATTLPIFHIVISEMRSTFSFEVIVRDEDADEHLLIQNPLLADLMPSAELVDPAVIPDLVDSLPGQSLLAKRFQWDLSPLLNEDTSSFPLHYGFTLVASDDVGSISLPIAVNIYRDSYPTPTITLDRTRYYEEDVGSITILDPSMDRNADLSVFETITAIVQSGLNPSAPAITLHEVPINDDPGAPSGMFRGTFSILDRACTNIEVGRAGRLCAPFSIRYGDPAVIPPVEVQVSKVAVRLDRMSYNVDQPATITVIDNNPGGNTRQVSARSPSQPGVSTILLERVAAGSDTFVGNLEFSLNSPNAGGGGPNVSNRLVAAGGDRITVSMGPAAGNQGNEATAQIFNGISVAFGRDESAPYNRDELATMTVVDVGANTDPSRVDRVSVHVSSSAEPPGSLGVDIDLEETGINTSTFRELTYLTFNVLQSNNEAKSIKIFPDVETRLTISYAPVGERFPEPPADGYTSSATVQPVYRLPPPPPLGLGGENNPVAAEPFAPAVTKASCGSYGDGADHDGICSNWEAPSKSYLTVYYGGWQQFTYLNNPMPSTATRDLLIEIDTLNGSGPTATTKSDIKTIFDNYGIDLQFSPVSDNIDLNTGDGDNDLYVWADPNATPTPALDSFKEIKEAKFGDVSGELLTTNKGKAKKQVFHYVLYGTTARQDWNTGSSGIAEVAGDDFIVTLGNWAAPSADKQKGTFMHELGHNLALHHGGGVDHNADGTLTWNDLDYAANCKPNYLSAMSYARQFPDAFSFTLGPWEPTYSNDAMTALNNGYDMDTLNEQNGPNPTIASSADIAWAKNSGGNRVAAHKDVLQGVEGTSQDNIDWNGGGIYTSGTIPTEPLIHFNIPGCNSNNLSNAPSNIIHGFDDWSSLVLDFRTHISDGNWGAAEGFGGLVAAGEMDNKTFNEIQQLGIRSLAAKIDDLPESSFIDGNNTKNELIRLLIGGPGTGGSGGGGSVAPGGGGSVAPGGGGSVAPPMMLIPPAYAQAVSIETSADHLGSKFFGESYLQVVVEDPDADDDDTIEQLNIEIGADSDSGDSANENFVVPETSESSGRFEFYLVHQNATKVGPEDLDAINNNGIEGVGTCVTDCAPIITFGPAGDIAITSDLYQRVEFEIIASNENKNIDYEQSIGNLNLDQGFSGSQDLLTVLIFDQDANLNPTNRDEFIVNPQQDPNSDLFHLNGGIIQQPVTFEESGDNLAVFAAQYQLGTSIACSDDSPSLIFFEKANYGANLSVPENNSNMTRTDSFSCSVDLGNVLTDIKNLDMRGALDKLLDVYLLVDGGTNRGNSTDDWIIENNARDLIETYLTTNIQSVSGELSQDEFGLGSRNDRTYYTIVGRSDDGIRPQNYEFTIVPNLAIEDITLVGQGEIELFLEHTLLQGNLSLTSQNMIIKDNNTLVTNYQIRDSDKSFYAQAITIELEDDGIHNITITAANTVVPEFGLGVGLILALTAIIMVVMTVAFSNRSKGLWKFYGRQ